MFKIALTVVLSAVLAGGATAQDLFTGLNCKSDFAKTLMGKKIPSVTMETMEKRHPELGLDDFGASPIDESLGTIVWSICGTRYTMLTTLKSSLILDMIAMPPASKHFPMFGGTCERNHVQSAVNFVGVLDNSRGYDILAHPQSTVLLPATSAWKIDEKLKRFVAVPTADLACSVQGVLTRDGVA